MVGIKRWIDDAEDPYAMRIEMGDGSRSPKLDLRSKLAHLVDEIDVRMLTLVRELFAEAMRKRPW
jgi:hypothetical protein